MSTEQTVADTVEAKKVSERAEQEKDETERNNVIEADKDKEKDKDKDKDKENKSNASEKKSETEQSSPNRFDQYKKVSKDSNKKEIDSFRINLGIEHLLIPYSLSGKALSIKPGGTKDEIKPFILSSDYKIKYKKVGARIAYSIKELLSVREKFKAFMVDVDIIPGVFEEGLGEEIGKNQDLINEQSPIFSSIYNPGRGGGDDTNASFRETETLTPSKLTLPSMSKLKKKVDDSDKDKDIENEKNKEREKEKENRNVYSVRKTIKPKEKEKDKDMKDDNMMEDSFVTIDSNSSNVIVLSNSTTVTTSPASTTMMTASTNISNISNNNNRSNNTTSSSTTVALSQRNANAWKPRSHRKFSDKMSELTRALTVALNKITLDNFNTLSKQIIDIFNKRISEAHQLEKLVSLIFEKTVSEHNYAPLYAKLCVELANKNKTFPNNNATGPKKSVGFKTILLRQCQKEFEKGKVKAIITPNMDKEDIEFAEIKQKKKLMGTMKFIGQLYLHQLLPSKIMTVCLRHLIGGQSNQLITDDDIEGACNLLRVCGKKLEMDIGVANIQGFYRKLQSIQNNKRHSFQPRTKILIKNLLEDKKNNWNQALKQSQLKTTKQIKNEWLKSKNMSGNNNLNSITNIMKNVADEDDEYEKETFLRFLANDNLNIASFSQNSSMVDDQIRSVIPINTSVVNNTNKKKKFRIQQRYVNDNQQNMNRMNQQNSNNMNNQRRNLSLKPRKMRSNKTMKLLNTKTIEIIDIEENLNEYVEEEEIIDQEINNETNAIDLNNRPCMNGPEISTDFFDTECGKYLESEIKLSAFLNQLNKKKISNRVKFISDILRKALDRSTSAQERTGEDLIPQLLNKRYIIFQEMDKCLTEFFEFYTMEESDNPQLTKGMTRILGPLIAMNGINLISIINYLELDKGMNKAPRFQSKAQNQILFTKKLEFFAELFLVMKEYKFDDSNFVRNFLKENNFNINNYISNESQYNAWIKHYRLGFAF